MQGVLAEGGGIVEVCAPVNHDQVNHDQGTSDMTVQRPTLSKSVAGLRRTRYILKVDELSLCGFGEETPGSRTGRCIQPKPIP